ncbi:MAG TPA: hypothetical protein VF532_03370 [Candidatus Angelobacter sp.]
MTRLSLNRQSVVLIGAAVTAVAGGLSYFFENLPLFAPGFVVAFILNGGGHEHRLNTTWVWIVAAVFNLFAYTFLSWIALRIYYRVRKSAESQSLAARS